MESPGALDQEPANTLLTSDFQASELWDRLLVLKSFSLGTVAAALRN